MAELLETAHGNCFAKIFKALFNLNLRLFFFFFVHLFIYLFLNILITAIVVSQSTDADSILLKDCIYAIVGLSTNDFYEHVDFDNLFVNDLVSQFGPEKYVFFLICSIAGINFRGFFYKLYELVLSILSPSFSLSFFIAIKLSEDVLRGLLKSGWELSSLQSTECPCMRL